MVYLKLENVFVEKKGEIHLNNVNLEIEKGEYVALLGPTNSGKTSMLNVIAGLKSINSGKILLEGRDITHLPPEDRMVGYVFEDYNLFPHLTVLENLLFGVKVRDGDLEQATRAALELLKIMHLEGREDAYPRELSGGMQQRVSIARAAVAQARILLLDEPYRALDAKIREQMRREMRQIVKDLGLTCIHATHELEEAMIVADKIVVLNEGRIEQVATPEELFKKPKNYYVATSISENNEIIVKNDPETEILPGIKLKSLLEKTGFSLSNREDKIVALIRYSDIDIIEIVEQIIKYTQRPEILKKIEKQKNQESIVLKGKVVSTRLLGEYVRFGIQLKENPDLILYSKHLLNLVLSKYMSFLGKEVRIRIPLNSIMLFYK